MAREVSAMLIDIRSAHNVGAIFRSADCAGITRLYLAGYTPSPNDEFGRLRVDVEKTALGATESVAWEMCDDALTTLRELKDAGVQIIALEATATSTDYRRVPLGERIVFVVGNEVGGLSEEVLTMADVVVNIPLRGAKESLNVSSAFAVAAYAFTDELRPHRGAEV